MMKRKRRSVLLCVALALLLVLLVYLHWENNRIVVRTQEVVIDGLPAAFDGFTFLQLSDLHGKTFGKNQARLLRAIAQAPHDVVLLTGDMAVYTQNDLSSCRPVMQLLTGLSQCGEEMYWVDGNWGPYAVVGQIYPTGLLSEMGQYIESLGAHVLLEPVAITRGDARIYLTPKLNYQELYQFSVPDTLANAQQIKAYHARLLAWYEQLYHNGEIKIAVSHHPESAYQAEERMQAQQPLDYALMISGHNHGGQVRLPFLGALYIPTVSRNGRTILPDQRDVMGLSEVAGVAQYISAGLGASNASLLSSFRFWNPPVIDRIVLRCGQ